jgi:hypothetical protein
MQERLAAMEARLAALESRRDLIVTPWFVNNLIGNGTIANSSVFTFNWFGGRLWVVMGGTASTNNAAGSVAANAYLNGTVFANPSTGADPTGAVSHPGMTLPLVTTALSPSLLTLGSNVLQVAPSTNCFTCSVNGLLIEWPQA